jgi:hypothetical protein
MPCSDNYPPAFYGDHRHTRVTQENAKLSTLLCEACTAIDAANAAGAQIVRSHALLQWWSDHKALDAERIKREEAEARRQALRVALLKKLSREEKDALGLK